jgi:hypothetical protein
MKRVIAVILISLLVAPTASAGQKPPKLIDWQKAQQLKPGTEIVLTVSGGQPTKVRLLFADEAILMTLKATAPKLPRRVEEFLLDVGPRWPSVVSGGSWTFNRLQVSPKGIFDGDEKLVDLAAVVQQTPRTDVLEIAEPPHSHVLRNVLGVVIIGLVWLAFWVFGSMHPD